MNSNDLKGINNLMENKTRLQNELKMVEKELKMKQESCNHVVVQMNCPSRTPFDNFRVCYDCILCGEKNVYPIKRLVDARKYLRDKYNDIAYPEHREEKFQILHKLALELVEENPSMTEGELAIKLGEIVDNNIETIESYQKIKK